MGKFEVEGLEADTPERVSQRGLTDEGTPELRQATRSLTCQEATARANTLSEVTLTYLRSRKVDSMTEGEKCRKVVEALGRESLVTELRTKRLE